MERELTSGTITASLGLAAAAAAHVVDGSTSGAPREGTAQHQETTPLARRHGLHAAASAKTRAIGRTHSKPLTKSEDEETPIHRALRTSVAIRVGPSYGAGVLVSADGLILTVNHVLEDAKPVRVSVAGLPWQDARVISRDILADLALLSVKVPSDGPQRAASLGSVTSCQPGDNVFTIGSPASMHFSLARGVLSFVGRRFGSFRYIQTDLPIHPGNSGGPVFNDDGEVVGLMTFVLRSGQNLGFAIPVDYARAKFPELQGTDESGEKLAFTAWAQAKVESPL